MKYLIKKDRNVLTNWNSFSEAKIRPENENKLSTKKLVLKLRICYNALKYIKN